MMNLLKSRATDDDYDEKRIQSNLFFEQYKQIEKLKNRKTSSEIDESININIYI